MTIKKHILRGEVIPRFYGMAWRCWEQDAAVCYPLPLNWIFAWFRSVYFLLIQGPRNKHEEKIVNNAFEKGRLIGRDEVLRDRSLEIELMKALQGILKGILNK